MAALHSSDVDPMRAAVFRAPGLVEVHEVAADTDVPLIVC